MNLKESLSKLKASKEFKQFKKNHPSAYLCAAFFIIDYESEHNVQQLDFQLDDKIATFSFNDKVSIKLEDSIIKEKVPRIKENTKIELYDAEKTARKEIEKQQLGNINKIIAILQVHDKKQIWNLTCILAGLQIFNIHISSENGKILKSEKTALTDFFNKPADYMG